MGTVFHQLQNLGCNLHIKVEMHLLPIRSVEITEAAEIPKRLFWFLYTDAESKPSDVTEAYDVLSRKRVLSHSR